MDNNAWWGSLSAISSTMRIFMKINAVEEARSLSDLG
jgi:hypothetical protein